MENKKVCSVFSAGNIKDYSIIDKENCGYIICADAGFLHTEKLGLIPDLIVGDFDTLSPDSSYKCEILKYPIEKDDTDTMLAVKCAIERGYTDLKIYGALGGRIDHTFANIQTLAYAKQNNINASIIGDNEIITILNNEEAKFKLLSDYYLSIFSYSEICEGVTLDGVKYPLKNAVLENSFPLGVSNEIINDFCSINVEKGSLLIVFSKKSSPF